MPDLPARIGPVEFEQFGAKWVAVRCPAAFDELMRLKGGVREAGSRRWLIPRWRINPLLRELRRVHRSAVPAGGDRSGRLKPIGRRGGCWRGSGRRCGGSRDGGGG